MKLDEPDDSGRCSPVPIAKSEFIILVDEVIMALGTIPNPLIINSTRNLKATKHNCIEADINTGLTSHPGVFAGGDAVTGAATVILAMSAGKKAAQAIDRYINNEPISD